MADIKVLPRFNPPAFLNDLKTDKLKQGWSDIIKQWMQEEITATGDESYRTPLTQFFDPTETPFNQSAAHANVTWIAFPKRVTGASDLDRWQKADADRDVQDEYLEWSVQRDNNKNIVSVTFTCEGPEYWEFMGKEQPTETFELIKSLNKPLLDDAKMEWFFKKDPAGNWNYDRTNKYNNNTSTGAIINLFQENNTLSAEVDIAAQATVIRQKNGKIITDQDALIKCSQYGDPNRNSDPTIGGQINAAARKGYSLSVADPVALYIQSFSTSNLYLDTSGNQDGTNLQNIPSQWMELQRGSALDGKVPLALRLRIRNNTGATTDDGSRLLNVSDIWDDQTKNNIVYGAQFTDYIQMGVAAVLGAQGPPPTLNDALTCFNPPSRLHHNASMRDSVVGGREHGAARGVRSRRS
ncbi:hypothetical protein MBLNU459_g7781t1 [Dothideomycetes sp. NU459]